MRTIAVLVLVLGGCSIYADDDGEATNPLDVDAGVDAGPVSECPQLEGLCDKLCTADLALCEGADRYACRSQCEALESGRAFCMDRL